MPPPTMDKYYAAVHEMIPLPSFGGSQPPAAAISQAVQPIVEIASVASKLFDSIRSSPLPPSISQDVGLPKGDEFEDFVAADAQHSTINSTIVSNNVSDASADLMNNTQNIASHAQTSVTHAPLVIGMSAFDAFGEIENSHVPSMSMMLHVADTASHSNPSFSTLDDDFSEFEGSNVTSVDVHHNAPLAADGTSGMGAILDKPAYASNIDEDEFGDFGAAQIPNYASLSVPASMSMSAAAFQQTAVALGSKRIEAPATDDFGDFGEFESETPSMEHKMKDVSPGITSHTPRVNTPLYSGQTTHDAVEDDFGDFGDYNISTPSAMRPPSPASSPPPLPGPTGFAAKVSPSGLRSLVVDHIPPPLVSLTESNSSTPPVPSALPSPLSRTNSFGLGLSGIGPSPKGTPLSSPRVSPRPSLVLTEIMNLNPVQEDIMSAVGENLFINHTQLTSLSATPEKITRPMTLQELESLANRLKDKHLYEAAYLTAAQMAYRQRLIELSEEKNKAIEADDLEKALEIKKSTNLVISFLAPLEEERKWANALQGQAGESLSDQVELIESSLSRTIGKGCKCLFILRSPLPDLMEELRFLCVGRRCVRLIITVHTTHKSLIAAWAQMATLLIAMLDAAIRDQIQGFRALCPADQTEVKNSARMQSYIEGIIGLAELGMHVAASMLNTLSPSRDAETLETSALTILLEVSKLWNVHSDVLALHDRGMLLKELGVDLPLGTNVLYCNLTLRPMGIMSSTGELLPLPGYSTKVMRMTVVDTPRGDAHYMSVAIQFYKRHISPNLPEIDCPFHGYL